MKILVVNKYCGFHCGVERYIFNNAELLRDNGHELWGLFEEETDTAGAFKFAFQHSILHDGNLDKTLSLIHDTGFDMVAIHKTMNLKLIEKLTELYPSIIFMHDHEYNCMKLNRHFSKFRLNCHIPFNIPSCYICSRLLSRNWMKENRDALIDPFRKSAILNAVKNGGRAVVLSQFMKDTLLLNGFEKHKIDLVHPFVVPKERRNEADDRGAARILFAGPITRLKGVDLLVKAAKYLKSDFWMTIVGRGPYESSLRMLIESSPVSHKIRFKGFSLDMPSEYEEADIVAVPSVWMEPFGLVGIEAFSYGKPVVAFDSGGISEWLRDGYNGLLVEKYDPRLLAEKLDELISNPAKAKLLGKNGYRTINEKFSPESYLKDFNQIAVKAISDKRNNL